MTRTITILLLTIFCSLTSIAQTNMVYGEKHSIFIDTPKNWVAASYPQLPYFIKPDEENVSENTYMYVYGLDYEGQPEIDKWIKGNNTHQLKAFPDLKIDSLDLEFKNIKKEDYLTGKYKVVTYEYPEHKKEALLVIECKSAIATVVFSAKDPEEFDNYLNAFIDLGESVKIVNTVLKEK